MPRRPSRTAPTVLVPGWNRNGPDHWQSWLAEQLGATGRQVRTVDFRDPDVPDLPSWLVALRSTVAGLPDDGFDVLAHSLGAVLWLHHAAAPGESARPARVALVAPPSPTWPAAEIAGFLPPPLSVDAVRAAADGTVLVGSDDDPFCPEGAAVAYGRPLKMPTTVVPGGGHLNSAAGFGPWPAVLDWCGRDNLAFLA